MRLNQAARAMAEGRDQMMAAREGLTVATTELGTLKAGILAEERRRLQTAGAIVEAERELAEVDPESYWVAPPATLPEWNDESPYIWIRKEIIRQLPVSVFSDIGTLLPEAAVVLMIDRRQLQELNVALERSLSAYREAEVSKVERVEEHLAGIAGREGVKMTLRVPPLPEEGARYRAEFEEALRGALGGQRAELVMKVSGGWIDSTFSQFGTEPRTISAIRHPNGSVNVSMQSEGSWMSVGIDASNPGMIFEYIPRHLAPFFSEVLEGAPQVPGLEGLDVMTCELASVRVSDSVLRRLCL